MTQTRTQYVTDTITNHTSAEVGGISGLPGLAPTGNVTNWSRAAAKAELVNGNIKQAQFISVMQQIAGWEQSQMDLSLAKLRNDSPDPLPR
jgi:hypothetical protein